MDGPEKYSKISFRRKKGYGCPNIQALRSLSESPIPVCQGESSSCGGEEDGMRSEGAAALGDLYLEAVLHRGIA